MAHSSTLARGKAVATCRSRGLQQVAYRWQPRPTQHNIICTCHDVVEQYEVEDDYHAMLTHP
jgi:hypothetical protein